MVYQSMMRIVNRISPKLLAFAVWAMVSLIAPAVALAQDAPRTPSLKRAPAPLLGYAIVFALVLLVLIISLLPSKRSHQD